MTMIQAANDDNGPRGLPGALLRRVRMLRALLLVLLVLIAMLAVGSVTFVMVARLVMDVRMPLGAYVGLVTALGMLTGVFLLLAFVRHRLSASAQSAHDRPIPTELPLRHASGAPAVPLPPPPLQDRTGATPDRTDPHGPALSLRAVLALLETQGAVALPGALSGASARWQARRRRLVGTMLAIGAAGAVILLAGIALRAVSAWAALIPAGFLLCFAGLAGWGLAAILGQTMAARLRAERLPVAIDRRGTTLRGIGPVPWGDVAAPERVRVRVKNDIGGECTVMPLTPIGYARVNAHAATNKNLVGPKPYLRFDVPYLLLPGVEGLTEDEVLHLFRAAHERFTR